MGIFNGLIRKLKKKTGT